MTRAHAREESCYNGKQYYRTSIRHIESGGIGYDDGYTTLEAFLVADPSGSEITPFFDIRGHLFDNKECAANIGAGLRTLWRSRVYGVNVYYDYRNAKAFGLNQMGVGFETLGEIFDFRINGYLPFGSKISDPYDLAFETFFDHFALISEKYQSAMRGANAEFGFHLGTYESFDFYTAAGPYYFTGNIASSTFGGKVRIASTFQDILTLEISNSYDRTFHNNFQGQISLTFSFGKKKKPSCKFANGLNSRMIQPVSRQEIIVIDKTKKTSIAINPLTGLPYIFVFVDNTSSSKGTYESPYPTLVEAQNNSSPYDVIYVFPGDGTTTGMNSGISLQAYQKFWGSGISHPLQTTVGTITIPAYSSSSPIITNTNVDTDGNAVDLATNNVVSGFTITSALNDAIYGTDLQSLEVSSCTIENTNTFPIEASFSGDASISITDNQFLDNTNGILLTLNGTSSVVCSNNTFKSQTSVSSVPLEISVDSNSFSAYIENNIFNENTTGSIRFNIDNVVNADINLLNNTITNNGTGSQDVLGSSVVVISNGTSDNCSITLKDNMFSSNVSNSLYMYTSGEITTLAVTVSDNTMSDNGGSGIVLATPTHMLTLLATNNTITGCHNNGIAVISSASTTTGTITINNNTITDIGNTSNGIAINQDFSNLDLTISNNEILRCEGTGVVSYAPTGIDTWNLQISDNIITDCENLSSNAASGLDIEQFQNFEGSVTNNTFSGNAGTAVVVGSTLSAPVACLTLTDNNNSSDYLLSNPGDGTFYLSPCNAASVNVGTINTAGTIDAVQSCSNPVFCTP
ncbi:MAG: right-handed parallel beta-helix repeat-containing protein [Chlamydiales bacterium]|nr:right-handed parallel beta-helix repeat-containing protein [Chlamydiales bacterium]